ncbi:MAG: YeiH family protein, partial [Verrucomicrobiota bacterium]
ATVFTLNSVALFLFPVIGHLLRLDQEAFGIWAGVAIHDTSSVVGAASSYGLAALATGTTVKLSRAVWIAPCVLAYGWFRKSEGNASFPWFIAGFIAAAAVRSALPHLQGVWHGVAGVARQALVVTLFLIGAGLGPEVLKKVGFRPMIQGVLLWLLVGSLSLLAITQGLIR